jgi:L-ascorbate metabolism protein UlaG (beta-lactamase superfamily)
MDVDDAIQAVELIDPELVIPCHYSVPFLWKRKFAVADDARFKREVEALGKECRIFRSGDVANV